MKAINFGPFALARAARRRGVALIIVLSCLVLLSVLIVGFFTSVTNEYTTTQNHVAGSSTRFLADTAVNVVMGQITTATDGTSEAGSNATRQTWASQPGMIRTYGENPGQGNAYKLYSSGKMVVPENTVKAEMAADVPVDWNTNAALFTDLNAPVIDANQSLRFPILNGNVKALSVNSTSVLTYDDDNNGKPDIEGFSVDQASIPHYKTGEPISATNNPVAMPARWIYVLKDGTLVSPDAGSSTQATFSGVTKPTKENPISGRIAFWTDDESSKLNINTASEGSYYAFPHFNTATDISSSRKTFGYAISPPAFREFNRYPGHPASTSLSVALGNWMDQSGGNVIPTAYSSSSADTNFLTSLEKYMRLAPRTEFGGSKAGTHPGLISTSGGNYSGMPAISDRLYASSDEVIFSPPRLTETEVQPLLNSDSEKPLEKLQFFLTASSRAAEVTPFNTPKISMWPQWQALAERTSQGANAHSATMKAAARLLAFCSSFGMASSSPSGKNEYFFQRLDANSWKSGTIDWGIPRNQELAKYLSQLGSNKVPGYGGSFLSKYGQNSLNSLIVQTFDYIRSNIGKVAYITSDYSAGNSEQWIAPIVATGGLPGVTSENPVKGYGSFPICTQIVAGVVADQRYYDKADPSPDPQTKTLTPFLFFELFIPTQSLPGSNPGLKVRIDDANNLGIPSLSGSVTIDPWGWYNNKSATMRVFWRPFEDKTFTHTGATITLGSATGYPVVFSLIDPSGAVVQKLNVVFPQVVVPAPKFFANLKVTDDWGADYYWYGPTQVLTNAMSFDKTDQKWKSANPAVPAATARGIECSATGPLRGDWRLMGGLFNVDKVGSSRIFTPLELTTPQGTFSYSNSSHRQVHSLRMHVGGALDGFGYWGMNTQPIRVLAQTTSPPTTTITGSLGTYLSNTDYDDFQAPCAPVGLGVGNNPKATNQTGRQGDWDTGPGLMPDGPYLNPTEQLNNISPVDAMGNSQFFKQNDNAGLAMTPINITDSFSPNRLVASPVKLGSLPTGVDPQAPKPWQTLLFCPNPASRVSDPNISGTASDHPGFGTPPDHAFLEFFTMPTVEPYAISEPLSTAGKVNLNYQLAPFSNIERSTALRGVLKSTLMTAVSAGDVSAAAGSHPTSRSMKGYKFVGNATDRYPNELRYDIDRDRTLAGVKKHYFDNGKIFRLASEVCDVFLVPSRIPSANYLGAAPPTDYDGMMRWWTGTAADKGGMNLTGDNLREEPYDRIYPRLTTKSNTYTVHYRVQVLRKRPNSSVDVWDENTDLPTAESRGSTMIERYIDPADPQLDSAWDRETRELKVGGKTDLSQYYKFRVINSKKFAP